MVDDTLESLRALRAKADKLSVQIGDDLRPFLHSDGLTFRRTPSSASIPNDVSVTSTCSCIMGLAAANQFEKFYGSGQAKAKEILKRLIEAEWMSSGLSSNNAFTTTLVLRAYGFLLSHELVDGHCDEKKQFWDIRFKDATVLGFSEKLKHRDTDTLVFLYTSLSDNTRRLVGQAVPTEEALKKEHSKKLEVMLTKDLRRIVHGSSLYGGNRFPKASQATRDKFKESLTTYKVAQLNYLLLKEEYSEVFPEITPCTLDEIALRMATTADNFKINEYAAAEPVVYWFVDAIARRKLKLEAKQWESLCEWASKKFSEQCSLVLAAHDIVMDPVSMGMAACLCSLLTRLAGNPEFGITEDARTALPSKMELSHSIRSLFDSQTKSGIWPKYFPMFHYQDAGSNFCFTFELLEAVLHEFGYSEQLLRDQKVIDGLSNAVAWCENNRHSCIASPHTYTGWNSGGDIESLKREQPESWATAVVHMFLGELSRVLSEHIQDRLLLKYNARREFKIPDESALNGLLDIELFMQGKHEGLKAVLKDELVKANKSRNAKDLRKKPADGPVSALLFGPPGTSKTQVTQAVARAFGWPLVTIDPSVFVKETMANIYFQADEIFRDLMDLSGVVVFFDEMDALAQNREDNTLDTSTQLLTTLMLPKLADLHDRARVVFFMATNFQRNFDAAIKRAGRFDLLLCMGPPTLKEKINGLELFFLKSSDAKKNERRKALADKAQIIEAKKLLEKFTKDNHAGEALELYTYAEFRSFLNRLGTDDNIDSELKTLGDKRFQEEVHEFSKYVTLRIDEVSSTGRLRIHDYDGKSEALAQLTKGKEKLPLVHYLKDRNDSRRQYK